MVICTMIFSFPDEVLVRVGAVVIGVPLVISATAAWLLWVRHDKTSPALRRLWTWAISTLMLMLLLTGVVIAGVMVYFAWTGR